MKHLICLLLAFFVLGCSKSSTDDIKICASRCPSSTPWRAESLDLGLPCFATKEECLQWVREHGYNDMRCVTCN